MRIAAALLSLLIAGCDGAHADFEVPKETRGAVVYAQYGGHRSPTLGR